MFRVNNLFHEESLAYQNAGKYMHERQGEIEGLQEIISCCAVNDESLECDVVHLYEQEIEPKISLADWLFCGAGQGDYDLRRMLMELLQIFSDFEEEKDYKIDISMGGQTGCVCNGTGYWTERRKHLANIHKTSEFYEFMKTCFVNTEFSEYVKSALREVKNFPQHTHEIVYNLSLLNDEAIEIYEKHQRNEKEAMRELASKALDCSGDSHHKEQLIFPFTYYVEDGEEQHVCIAEITCEPHMKLIRRDSDLRIYFYWRDMRIANGEKVLVGKIGGHPY